jgi:argininosuccinate lyase
MLAQQKLITQPEFKAIEKGLVEISKDIEAGRFEFDKSAEDIHMAIEAALIKRIGDPGAKLHTGRSRNDQVATDVRLWLRDEIETLQAGIAQLQKVFVELASKHTDDPMPAYTPAAGPANRHCGLPAQLRGAARARLDTSAELPDVAERLAAGRGSHRGLHAGD